CTCARGTDAGSGDPRPKGLGGLIQDPAVPEHLSTPGRTGRPGGDGPDHQDRILADRFNHPWRIEMINSARAEVARHPNVQIIVTDGKVDVVKQSGDIADLLAQGVDAIVMSPVEDAGLRAAARKAMQAGKPVIVLDRDVSVDKTLFMGQSNVTMAAGVASVLVAQLKKKYGAPKGNVVEITGMLGSTPAQGRHQGFESIVKQYPDIKVLAT